MKKLPKVLVVCGVLFVGGALLWVVLLPRVVASTIRSRTGFAVQVDKLSVNPFTANIAIRGLVLKNPDGWPVADFVDLREFHADVDLFSLFGRRLEADEITVDVARLTLAKNQQGTLNAVAFKDGWTGKSPDSSKKAEAKHDFLIRHLVLKFDKLVYADHSGRQPSTKEYNLNLNREMRDVDSVAKLVSPLSGAALGIFTDTLGGMFKDSPEMLKGLTGDLQDAGKKTGEMVKGLIDSLEKKKP